MAKRDVGLKIRRVRFRANEQLGERFHHIHIEAEAEVGPDDDPQDVLDELKVFVAQQLARAKKGDPELLIQQAGGRFSGIRSAVE